MSADRQYRVLVPDPEAAKRKGRYRWTHVSYPASGHLLYTREEAIGVLKVFAARCAERAEYGHTLECYAEGTHERFHLSDLEPAEYEHIPLYRA